ncbi:hypothetical protein RND81_04G185700 [Saponaria officinalis]|uniref:Clp R domain-containing protein n=1 Tax=Saponaria officinalis TaxID=3572 RepID=A0AAW1LMR4_SAPOF
MRTGGCNIQQSLTQEATTIVKQAINLARRRGHAQVTPIHVASVMLASPTGLLRVACLKSHSHPLQCKALELCFNVALNRLPTTSPAPILGPHSHYPSLANALMAAFKRAQAHQRRGSIESQQQPILALKIETQQLVTSILDDPSVSRVMREAGFSSTHVKSNVDHAVSSLEGCSQTTTTTTTATTAMFDSNDLIINNINNSNSISNSIKSEIASSIIFHSTPNNNYQTQTQTPFTNNPPINHTRHEDVSSVIDSWIKRKDKSSVVLIGECLTTCENVVKGLKQRVERGDVPIELRYVQFLNCPLLSMKNMSREEIDLKLGEVRCFLKGCLGRGVVLYLGDLRWVSEYWAYYGEQRRHYYCAMEHLVMGLRRLVFGNVEFGRLWLMGVASFSTYLKCKLGNPSLETLLDLHPLTIPHGTLDLSLKLDSSLEEQSKSFVLGEGINWSLHENKDEMQLTCCPDCSANYRREAKSLAGSIRKNESTTTTTTTSTSSSLPSWLQKYKEESRESSPNDNNDQEENVQIKELCKKWNSICNSSHKGITNFLDKTINFSSSSPSSSTSISSYETKLNWPLMFEPKWSSKEHQFLTSNNTTAITKDFFDRNERKPELLSNPNSIPNSTSSSEATEILIENPNLSFKENTPENLDVICSALENKVPWQKDIIPEIAMTVLRIRSGIMSRRSRVQKGETWLFFLGMDDEGKLKIGKELAKIIFGSYKSFKSIGISSFSSTRADSTEEFKNKRTRDESSQGYLERFAESVKENPHRVFFVEDVEQVDHRSQKGIKRAIETGQITMSNGETVSLEDAIVIFSCDSFSSGSRACSPPVKQKIVHEKDEEGENDGDDTGDLDEGTSSGPLDLNIAVDFEHGIEQSVGDFRILESVDKQVFFRVHVL